MDDCTANTAATQDRPAAYVEPNTGMAFCAIQAGSFAMGSEYADVAEHHPQWYADEKPIHEVMIEQESLIGVTQVTVAQFRAFVAATGYVTSAELAKRSFGRYHEEEGKASWTIGENLAWNSPGYPLADDLPVTHVSYDDAGAFCAWLTQCHCGRHSFSLLTEAQWEYCAGHAGRLTYSWGNDVPDGRSGGNIADRSFITDYPKWKYPVMQGYDDGFALVAPVGQYAPNPFGLYDMTGNVWEWVADIYIPYPNAPSDALAAYQANVGRITENGTIGSEDKLRVHRGAGFDWELPFLRIAKRRSQFTTYSAIHIGFRVAVENIRSSI